jgi:hypothetical protein
LRLLLTSAGVKNTSIQDALVDLLGKPIADSSALCIPTAMYGHPQVGPGEGACRFISGRSDNPMCELGWKSLGVLELTALPSIDEERWVPLVRETEVLHDLVLVCPLQEVAASPSAHGGEHRVVVLEHREYDDDGRWSAPVDPAGRLDAVEVGHAQVHPHDVGRESRGQLHRSGFAHPRCIDQAVLADRVDGRGSGQLHATLTRLRSQHCSYARSA